MIIARYPRRGRTLTRACPGLVRGTSDGPWLTGTMLANESGSFERPREHVLRHAVCITGLQRSYPEISHNIHYSLSHLYAAWRATGGNNDESHPGLIWTRRHSKRSGGERTGWSIGRSVAFFGVRPANDSWATVRTDLPPLQGESIQTPCGPLRPPWFSAYAKTHAQKITYGNSFVQMMCDLHACHELVKAYEVRVGRRFLTLARLRLDLAWETPLTMPQTLLPNTVYTSRMNTKQGMNDKWAIGRRQPMGAYFDRVQHIGTANLLYNRSGHGVAVRSSGNKEGLFHYKCPAGVNNDAFVCHANRVQGTSWQGHDQSFVQGGGRVTTTRRFVMTSEAFLAWSLWLHNISVAYEPKWMFCKFGNSINGTARICVPRMRRQVSCGSLICQGGLTDCFCHNTSCTPKAWYCQNVREKQLLLDPARSDTPFY